jgi:type I restriction enzyme S subunit
MTSLCPYSAYKPSGIEWLGDIPRHWTVKKLKSMSRMKSGEGITSFGIEGEGTFPVYGGNGIRGYAESFTHDGDYILVGRQGALCGNVHRVSGKFWASEHAIVVTPFSWVNVDWFGSVLRVMDLNQYSISAAQPGLAVERVVQLAIPAPPLPEQQAIADFLDIADARISRYIAAKRRMITLLEEQKQAIINQAVTRGLDPNVPLKPSGVDWLGDIPAHWEVKRAKVAYREIDQRSTSGEEESLSVSHLTGVTPRSQKTITMFKAESYIGHKLCQAGDVVVTRCGHGWALLGYLSLWD